MRLLSGPRSYLDFHGHPDIGQKAAVAAGSCCIGPVCGLGMRWIGLGTRWIVSGNSAEEGSVAEEGSIGFVDCKGPT